MSFESFTQSVVARGFVRLALPLRFSPSLVSASTFTKMLPHPIPQSQNRQCLATSSLSTNVRLHRPTLPQCLEDPSPSNLHFIRAESLGGSQCLMVFSAFWRKIFVYAIDWLKNSKVCNQGLNWVAIKDFAETSTNTAAFQDFIFTHQYHDFKVFFFFPLPCTLQCPLFTSHTDETNKTCSHTRKRNHSCYNILHVLEKKKKLRENKPNLFFLFFS